MTFLPIVTRELRVASRKRATYWVRSGAGVLVAALGLWLFVAMQGQSPRDLALGLFYVLTGSAVLYALLSGLRTTADSLSEEKREGTLGLLFLTDLKGYDVVLGKLVASSVNALYSVLAVLPMLAIPILLGGLTPAEFARMAVLALNALFFSLAAGIWASSMSRSSYQAMLATGFVLLLFTALLPACGSLLVFLGKTRTIHFAFLLPSVGFAYYAAVEQVYRVGSEPFLMSMVIVNLLGWAFLGLASFIVPRTWQDRPSGAQKLKWGERWRSWIYGNSLERAEFRRRLLDQNAFFWLAARVRVKPVMVWSFLALVACGWVWGLAKGRRAWLEPGMYLVTGLLLNFVIRCWFAAEATRQLAEERKSGTLELLLSTPLDVKDILRGQRLALARLFLGPVLVTIAAEGLFLAASLSSNPAEDAPYLIWTYTTGILMLVLDLLSLYWVGMWQGLSARNQSRAFSTAIARILVLPWVVIALVLLLIALINAAGVNPPDPGGWFFLGLWFVTGALVDAGFALSARHQLLTRFRFVAQQRYAAQPRLWSWLLGGDASPTKTRVSSR